MAKTTVRYLTIFGRLSIIRKNRKHQVLARTWHDPIGTTGGKVKQCHHCGEVR